MRPHDAPVLTRLLRLPQVLAVVPVSKSTWYAGVASGRYPKPVKLSRRIAAWREDEIKEVIENPR
jgi:predicted DNA-binding transcriptional regulator AlpA